MNSTVKKLDVTYNPISERNTFTNGDFITGQVTLEIGKDCQIDSLFVKFKAKADVMWTERHGQTTVVYHSKEKYFTLKQYFIRNQNAKGESPPPSKVLMVYLDVKYASDPTIKFDIIVLPALQGSAHAPPPYSAAGFEPQAFGNSAPTPWNPAPGPLNPTLPQGNPAPPSWNPTPQPGYPTPPVWNPAPPAWHASPSGNLAQTPWNPAPPPGNPAPPQWNPAPPPGNPAPPTMEFSISTTISPFWSFTSPLWHTSAVPYSKRFFS
ncbi:DNA-directed RNA polymerase II subunit RPB1 [Oryzias melastigma]|uniref:DNA-directed RNA polymerase II subunit RPB1 n=1 Tax=Oryzias melastigma TaxID=30732 RepID=A0A834CH25_ORYME|nr:DNA-directed RNA polymerase II subunit RPB1 [Oryzias melastigma]